MPDENRVFDVSKPGKASPHPAGRPVIVGHQPEIADPMVRDADSHTSIPVTFNDSSHEAPETASKLETEADSGGPSIPVTSPPEEDSEPAKFSEPEPVPDPEPAIAPLESSHSEEPPEPVADKPAEDAVFPSNDPAPESYESHEMADMAPIEPGNVEPMHTQGGKKGGKRLMMVILGLLIILIGAYLFIDSNAVDTGINLPVHIFKQKAKTTPPAATPAPAKAVVVTVPAGFTEYKLAGTTITFAAPTAWGTPTSTTDPGYSARGGTNKSDGSHAFLVDFATNKDVELAVTSSKYLPAARAALYYDYLQWCTGTADAKTYLGTLNFTTSTDKVDTPTTVTCSNGPLADATKLDSTTIVELNMKTADGKSVFGDLYTENLVADDLVVFRVKDSKSANSSDIKKLLLTVKEPVVNGSALSP